MHNAYGARTLLRRYSGVNLQTLKRLQIVWQHGWIPESLNLDPDVVVSESAEISVYPDWGYLVSRKDQEDFLKEYGITHARAVGLPFAYALKLWAGDYEREEGSLLVVPAANAHQAEDGRVVHLDERYVSYLSEYRKNFPKVTVMLRAQDIASGRDMIWREQNYEVVEGAGEANGDSLKEMVRIFSTHDVFTTNGFGSAIVYAAAAGCRISICGPRASIPAATIASLATVRNRPDLLPIYTRFFHPELLEEAVPVPSAYVDPPFALQARDWGLHEIGFENLLAPNEFRALLVGEKNRQKVRGDFRIFYRLSHMSGALSKRLSLAFFGFDSSKILSPPKIGRNIISLIFRRRSRSTLTVEGTDDVFLFRPRTNDLTRVWSLFREGELEQISEERNQKLVVVGCGGGAYLRYWKSALPQPEIVGIESLTADFDLCVENFHDDESVRLIGPEILQGFPADVDGANRKTDTFAFGNADVKERFSDLPALSDLLAWADWPEVDLMTMDIDGDEYALLSRWAPQLQKTCNLLLVRFHHRVARRKEFEELMRFFSSLPCEVELMKNNWVAFRFRKEK